MPAWMHGFLQKILMRLLDDLGLLSASEVRAKISPELELVPDVVATDKQIETIYAIDPPLVVIEILSPSDSAQRLWKKCALYAEWGVAAIYVVDPEERKMRMWDAAQDTFLNATVIQIAGHGLFSTDLIWEQLDKSVKRAQNATKFPK